MSENCSHNCSECGSECASRTQPQSLLEKQNEYSDIKKVIGVISGKGGVGKSLVTSLLASKMQKQGYKTAVLDADITGPSIPRIFGVHEHAMSDGRGVLPVMSKGGTKLMSVNLLLEDETDPVLWRGPIIGGTVKQFWTDVVWGDVDVMFADMPPGTGDVALTVFQSLPVDGIVVVTSPQELVDMIVGKAVKMAEMMNIPILGIAENMSYFECPSCKEKHEVFGKSHVEELAARYGIDTAVRIPIDPKLAAACDGGAIEAVEAGWIDGLAKKIEKI